MVRRLREKLQHVQKRNSTPAAVKAKTVIRQDILDRIGPENARVFDAYAGDGLLYRAVWHQAAACIGCDLEFYPDDRIAFKADNRRVMRAVDLAQFNIFDMDSYGSPWEQMYILAYRRRVKPGEQVAIVLTEGQGMKLKLGGMSLPLSRLAGVRHWLPGLAKVQDELIDRALARMATMMNATLIYRRQAAESQGSTMHYVGVIMRGNEPMAEGHSEADRPGS
jgi:hypothetical protein